MFLEELFALVVVCLAMAVALGDFRAAFLPKFTTEKSFQHLTYAVIFALFLLWSAQAGIKEGLTIHFLALTTLSLMYGWRIAFLLTIPVAFALALTGKLTLVDIPEYLMLSSLIPILISYGVFLLSYRCLPRNIFVFIFVAGFFNGGLTGSLHLTINTAYQMILGNYDWQTVRDNYLILVPLLAFPEGLLNGMSLAVLSVFKPEWLRTFSDRDYIYNHHHRNK